MTRTTALGLLCLAISLPSAVIQAQVEATSDREVFDVISIREARSGSPSSGIRLHPSGLTATGATALDLIRHAFGVVEGDVIGELPAWTRATKFDVVARTSAEGLTHSRLRAMSRNLLQDRFRLDASYEQVEAPVYALVVERSDGQVGPNLRPSTSASACAPDPLVTERSQEPVKILKVSECSVGTFSSNEGLHGIAGARITMQKVARALSHSGRFGRAVVDQTGLTGEFDMVALVSADIVGATSEARFLTAMREQLGLTLRSAQSTLDVLRIRRIQEPTPN